MGEGERKHGLGPHATVIEDTDGFRPVAVLVGSNVYVEQGDHLIVMTRTAAMEVAKVIQGRPGTAEPTAIVHIAADGEVDYQVTEGARLLIVDERAPGDRVYEVTSRITADDVAALIGEDEVGSQHDDRHPVLAARVIAAQEGRPHLRLVDDGEGRTDA